MYIYLSATLTPDTYVLYYVLLYVYHPGPIYIYTYVHRMHTKLVLDYNI